MLLANIRRTRAFVADPVRRFQMALVVIMVLLAGGTLGYMVIEGMSAVEGLYMTIITVSTVGFGEVVPLSPAGRIYTVVLILLGLVGFASLVSTATEIILGQRLWLAVQQRRLEEVIRVIENHYIVCGFGRMGRQIVRDLTARGEKFIVIDLNPAKEEDFLEAEIPYIIGDATHEDTYKDARVEYAKGMVAALDTDPDNVMAVLTAREMNPNLFIVARAETVTSESKLRRAGVDRVVSPYEIGGHRMALALLRPAVHDFLNRIFSFSDDLDVDIGQVFVDDKSKYVGQMVMECDLRQAYGVSILAIHGKGNNVVINPSPQRRLEAGDILIVIGEPDAIYKAEMALRTSPD